MLLWRSHLGMMVGRSYLRNIATTDGLIRIQIMWRTVSFAWPPLISHIVLMSAWYLLEDVYLVISCWYGGYLLCPGLESNQHFLSGDAMWSFFPFWLFTKVDGYKNGMPNMPASTATSLTRSCFVFILFRINRHHPNHPLIVVMFHLA